MKTRELSNRLARRVRKAGLSVAPEVADRLLAYFQLLALWNQKINLTGLPLQDAPDEAIDRLLIEPLVAARHLSSPDDVVMDVGSGGGSPAVPLKIAVPGISLRMVEAKTRKSVFLREVIRQLALRDASVETARFEELLARPDLHEAADVLTLRAVRVEGRVLMNLQAFVKPGGRIFLFRGPSGQEVPAAIRPPLSWEATFPLLEWHRSRLVVLRKETVGAARVATSP